jgi:hypothetical protein
MHGGDGLSIGVAVMYRGGRYSWRTSSWRRQVPLADFQVLANRSQSWSKAVPGGVSDGQFSGLLHFATNRTLSGWALLFAMGKVTSDDFLYGRKHSQIFECREIRSKTGSKTGLKRGPSRCPKHRKHRYTGKSSLQRGQKRSLKSSPKTTPK